MMTGNGSLGFAVVLGVGVNAPTPKTTLIPRERWKPGWFPVLIITGLEFIIADCCLMILDFRGLG